MTDSFSAKWNPHVVPSAVLCVSGLMSVPAKKLHGQLVRVVEVDTERDGYHCAYVLDRVGRVVAMHLPELQPVAPTPS